MVLKFKKVQYSSADNMLIRSCLILSLILLGFEIQFWEKVNNHLSILDLLITNNDGSILRQFLTKKKLQFNNSLFLQSIYCFIDIQFTMSYTNEIRIIRYY